jgi:hypothetical protein
MARAHKVWLPKLTCLATRLNAELDKGSRISLAEAEQAIRDRRVVASIKERFGVEMQLGDIGILDDEDDITISEAFERISCELSPSQVRVSRNGLCYLLALTIEMIAMQDWTTFDDPTSNP